MEKLSDFLIVEMTHHIFEFIAVYKQYEFLFSFFMCVLELTCILHEIVESVS